MAAEQSLHSTQLPGFSNQGFKTFHTIRVHDTVLLLVPVHSCSGEEAMCIIKIDLVASQSVLFFLYYKITLTTLVERNARGA